MTTESTPSAHMSIRMQRVRDAVRRMPLVDRLQILVRAGLMTEPEALRVASRPDATRAAHSGSKSQRRASPSRAAKRNSQG
jgi:hypothetical protein